MKPNVSHLLLIGGTRVALREQYFGLIIEYRQCIVLVLNLCKQFCKIQSDNGRRRSVITDRVRSTTVRYCFHRCLSVHTSGGYPSQGGTHLGYHPPLARSGWGPQPGGTHLGYPRGQVRMGGYPSQGGTCPGYPPWPAQDGGVPQPVGARLGYPPLPAVQQMEYLIRRGRYASCVHAGGLPRYYLTSFQYTRKTYLISTRI